MMLVLCGIFMSIIFCSVLADPEAPERKFIIARFNEDLHWLLSIADETVILNKGTSLPYFDQFAEVQELPNVGRESHSYLTYIVNNYDNLPEVLVFSQGRIDDHGYGDGLVALKNMAIQAKQHGHSSNFCRCHIPYQMQLRDVTRDHKYRSVVAREHITFGKWMDIYLNGYRGNLRTFWCGILAVRKDKILKRSKESYINLLKSVDYHNNPIEGHFFERAWDVIFNL